MYNPENRPTSRRLPDGRLIPVNKGLKLTEEEREKWSEVQSTTWRIIEPFVMRGAIPAEISDLVDIPRGRIMGRIRARQMSDFKTLLDYNRPDKVHERRVRGGKKATRKFHTHEVQSLAFAKRLVAQGKVNGDLNAWENVSRLLESQGRRIVDNFAYGIMLEVFWTAREQASRGDWSLFDQYMDLGRQTDRSWFSSEELNADRKLISQRIEPKRGGPNFKTGHYSKSKNF